jgi:hypothetical protein
MIKFIFNLIIEAGIDTSQTTLKWIILFMANYPEMQNKMREEIESVIGDRMPVQEDRNNCHYVNAFISETMRYRSIIPMGVVHKNVVQSKIGIINKKKSFKILKTLDLMRFRFFQRGIYHTFGYNCILSPALHYE